MEGLGEGGLATNGNKGGGVLRDGDVTTHKKKL